MLQVKGVDPEGSWECPYCYNINWPKRTTCNREGCHMPKEVNGNHPEGSWACPACSNINWPKRTECKKCNIPRSGAAARGAVAGLGGLAQLAAGVSGAQPGSWLCPNCANVNWPMRTVCNKPGCQTPKPPVGGLFNERAALDPYLQLSSYGGLGAVGGLGLGLGGGGGAPPGSWSCPSCGNVNWPKRTQCNKPGCGTPKPGFNTDDRLAGHPDGSWLCPNCSNVNWPQRTNCNKPGCQTPRPGI